MKQQTSRFRYFKCFKINESRKIYAIQSETWFAQYKRYTVYPLTRYNWLRKAQKKNVLKFLRS